jgi:hypothetical protein
MAYPTLPRRIWSEWDKTSTPFVFRRVFTMNSASEACLYVCASGDYEVYIDDTRIPQPDLYVPPWRVMRRLTVDLTLGTHKLSIYVNAAQNEQPFLLACLDWADGQRIGTDERWEMIAAPPSNWLGSTLDWQPVRAFDGVWAEPTGMPTNAPDDFCRLTTGWQTIQTETINCVLSTHQGLGSVEVDAEDAIVFRPARPFPKEPVRIVNSIHSLAHFTRYEHMITTNTWLDLFEGYAPHVIFDTGSETFARITIRLRHGRRAMFALTTGESVGEIQRYARRNSDVFELTDGETYTTSPIGLRYIKVMALSAGDIPLVIEPVLVQHIRYPVVQVGSFECSDPLLNEIWDIGAHTVHLCMQNEIWDGIKRDQLPWMGDLYTEALVVYHAFGDTQLARRSLKVLAELGPGAAALPQPPLYAGLSSAWRSNSADINDIPSYTMWWIIGLADFYRYTGDRLPELRDAIIATLTHISECVDEKGWWQFRDGWDYVDWAPIAPEERHIFCHLLACQVLALGGVLIGDEAAEVYRNLHRRMVSAAREYYQRVGTFGMSPHVNSMAIRSGVLTFDEQATLFEGALKRGAPINMTYWHRYADLDAAQHVGAIKWGLNYIRQHWGRYSEVGMTTLWEAFNHNWISDDPHRLAIIADEYAVYGGYGTSLCHGWSAGPTVWLHTAVLGIRFIAHDRITLKPDLGDLDWARGTIPTQHGSIHISLTRTSSYCNAEISSPENISVNISEEISADWHVSASKHG